MVKNWKFWLNAIVSALVAFLTAISTTSCMDSFNRNL